jgi:protein phosphatase
VLADGMGGLNAGEVASQEAVYRFLEALEEPLAARALARAVSDANTHVYELSRSDPELVNMGTTIVACGLAADGRWAVAHVGDSRAYLFRDGELQLLTMDHSIVQQMVEQGALSEEEAWASPNRHIITRAVGLEAEVAVEAAEVERKCGDVLLLCSDGLSDLLRDELIAEVLREQPSLDTAADQLIAAANRAGGTDNITVLLVQ